MDNTRNSKISISTNAILNCKIKELAKKEKITFREARIKIIKAGLETCMIKVLKLYGLDINDRLICAWCGEKIKVKDFKDKLSVKEYTISGFCLACQSKVFEK